jgi:hypothetical protein
VTARTHALSALAGFTLLAGGCSSTPYEGQRGLVETRLDQAEKEGAAKAKLQEVRDTLELAKAAEKRAGEDQMTAQKDLEWARDELPAARSRVNAVQRDLLDAQDELARAREQMKRLDDERAELIGRGVTEEQADSVVDADRNVVQLHIDELERVEAALRQRLELANLDRKTAEGYMNAANDRLAAAQARIALSGTLYQLADAQSRAIEGEALGTRRSELMERMVPTQRPVDGEAATTPEPIPTGTEQEPLQQQQQQQEQQELPELGTPHEPQPQQQPQQQQQIQTPPPLPTWPELQPRPAEPIEPQ